MEKRKKNAISAFLAVAAVALINKPEFWIFLASLIPVAILISYIYFWEKVNLKVFFTGLAGVVIWATFFTVKYLINFDSYSEEQLVAQSYYFLPPLIPFATAVFTGWKPLKRWAVIIPIALTVLSPLVLMFFYTVVFPEL